MWELYQIDAFADGPFTGNPAGVCLLGEERSAQWMQNVALEMNLSETAFLRRRGEEFDLRWFTPSEEVDLCGHATLASAHFLWESGILEPSQPALFQTRSGLLSARKDDGAIEMDFPAEPESACPAPTGLEEALGLTAPLYVGRNRFDLLVEAAHADAVRGLSPDFTKLRKIPVRGVIVTSRADSNDCDFVSRFFAPAAGVDEDPVTGSAHCCLGPFWSRRLGKDELAGRQLSRRGGTVGVRVRGDRVLLRGRAVTIFRLQAVF